MFLDGCFRFKTEDLLFALSWPFYLNRPCKCWEQLSLKHLKALEQRHWLHISETGSQFSFSNSFSPMCFLPFHWKQNNCGKNQIHLFWKVCNLLLNLLFRFGNSGKCSNLTHLPGSPQKITFLPKTISYNYLKESIFPARRKNFLCFPKKFLMLAQKNKFSRQKQFLIITPKKTVPKQRTSYARLKNHFLILLQKS